MVAAKAWMDCPRSSSRFRTVTEKDSGCFLWLIALQVQLSLRLLSNRVSIESTKKLEICERVKAYRVREGLTQEVLAEKLGISRNYVHLIEAGKKHPSWHLLEKFTEFETGKTNELVLKEDAPPYGRPIDPQALTTEQLEGLLASMNSELPLLDGELRQKKLFNLAIVANTLAMRAIDTDKK